jgi:phosphotransferase system IIB component
MIEITKDEIVHNLTIKYKDFKKYSSNNDIEQLQYTKGFCRALEQIAIVFGNFTPEEIAEIKRPIIGNINMAVEIKEDLDIPPHIRKNIDINTKIKKKNS